MAALDSDILAALGVSAGDATSVQNAPPVSDNLPPVPTQSSSGALNLSDLPPAMGAVGSHPGRSGHTIQNIILHSSDGRESGDLNTLTGSGNAGAHYYVTRAGQIYHLVNDEDTAFHAGRVSDPSYSNESTIGIEQEHYDPGGEGGKTGEDWPDVQVQASARLVAALQQKYNLNDSNVLYHSQIAFPAGRKQDPFNYPRDKFNQWVSEARSGQVSPAATTASAGNIQVPTVVYPWQAQDPSTVTVGDVVQQQQQRETGNLVTIPAQPSSSLQVRATHYAYPGEETPDPNSAKGLGVENRPLGSSTGYQSIAFSPDVEQGLNAKLGDQFVVTKADGSQQTVTFDDRTNQNLRGRADFYDPSGKIGDQGTVSIARAGQIGQSQQVAVNSVMYPWQNQLPTGITQDGINQAIQAALQRNAFASAEKGVPANYTPLSSTATSAATTSPAAISPPAATPTTPAPANQNAQAHLVLSAEGDPQARTKPSSFGMRVATQDDVKAYDQYIANGGDPNQIDPYDRLAVMLGKNANALLDPNNASLLDEMVLKPQQAANDKKTTGEKVWDGISAGTSMVGDVANSVAALARSVWKDTIPAVRALAEKATGQTPDPEALSGLTDLNALAAQGAGKTVSDVYNMLAMMETGMAKLNTNMSSMLTSDPQKLAEIHTNYINDLQKLVGSQQFVANLGNNLQGQMASAYSATGAFADLGSKLKTWQADPQAVEGISQIAQLVAPGALEALAGMKFTGAFKPLMAEGALESTTDTMVAQARKFFFDSTQKVPRDVDAEAANPNYFNTRAAQANLAPDARAADAGLAQENVNLQQKLTSLQKNAADPGTATQVAQAVMNAAGAGIGAAGSAVEKVNGLGDRLLNTLSLGSPTLRGIFDKVGRGLLFGVTALHGHAWAGRLAEMGIDALEHADAIPKVASGLQDFLKVAGQELAYGESSIPYWTRVSQGTRLIGPRMAAFLDSPAVQTIARGAAAAPSGMATGAFIGAISDPNDPIGGAVANALPGGVFGMMGGGFGQWLRYGSAGEAYLQARGDWQRSLGMMAGAQRDHFLSLAPRDQLMLGTYLQQVPGLRVNFVNEPGGVQGTFDPHIHTFDGANKPTITINTADPQGAVRAVFAHELMHATQSSGMLPDLYDALLGNPDRGTIGQYTAVDGKGNPVGGYRFVPSKEWQNVPDDLAVPVGGEFKLNPNSGIRQARWDEPPPPTAVLDLRTGKPQTQESAIDPATGRYRTNQEFQNFKNDYITNLARSGEPTSHLSDLDIAKEIYAEHGVNYLLSPQGVIDATSAFRPGWIGTNKLKNAYAKMGFTFDGGGNIVPGTGLFDNLQRNDAVDKLVQKFNQTRYRERTINSEDQPTRAFSREDLRSTNAADTFLDTAPEIMRNPDGSVMRDSRGVPFMRTPSEVKQYNAKLANEMFDRIEALPEDRKTDIGYKLLPNGNVFVRYLPQELRDALAQSNEYNPHQIKALNVLSEMLADNSKMGTNFRLFYNKALSENKRYGSFSGTEKFAVPYGFEISQKNNALLRSVDFDQLNQNYTKNATRAPFRQLWGNPSEFANDWNTYFQNHADGKPGATGIGEAKRDAINALLNLDTQANRDANPLLGARGRAFPGTRPIIKSYRIDRTSQVTPLDKTSPFTTEEQYYQMNRNYLPRKAGD